jgi:hypothetical protein
VLFADATLSPKRQGVEDVVRASLGAIGQALGTPVPVLYADQRHTSRSYVYAPHEQLQAGAHRVGECDAIITGERDVALLVMTADCLPVALAGEDVIAIIHAGWRGLAADILGAVARRIENEFGVPPAALSAAIGVGVGRCHYRVGADVRGALAAHPVSTTGWAGDGAVDLSLWALGRLVALGLAPGNVTRFPGCTACSTRHHSYRRDGTAAGRQWSAVVRPSS